MELGVGGRVVLVGGASQGIGFACARALAREGCRVALVARREEPLERATAELAEETGATAIAVPADLATSEGVGRAVAETTRRLGSPTVLVANAGGPPLGRFDDFSDDDWQHAFDLVLMSKIRLIRAVLPGMRAAGWGRIVAVESLTVKQPLPRFVLSNALRLASVGMLKTLSREVAAQGITVNAVLPGATLTERLLPGYRSRAEAEGMPLDEVLAREARKVPVGRLGSPDDLGAAVAYLCSEAARQVTGALLQVDGGTIEYPV